MGHAERDDEDGEPADSGVSGGTGNAKSLAGNAYAVVDSSSEVAPGDEGKTVLTWEVGQKLGTPTSEWKVR